MENVIIIIVLLLIAAATVFYIAKQKKGSRACIGCPYSKDCAKKCSCEKRSENEK